MFADGSLPPNPYQTWTHRPKRVRSWTPSVSVRSSRRESRARSHDRLRSRFSGRTRTIVLAWDGLGTSLHARANGSQVRAFAASSARSRWRALAIRQVANLTCYRISPGFHANIKVVPRSKFSCPWDIALRGAATVADERSCLGAGIDQRHDELKIGVLIPRTDLMLTGARFTGGCPAARRRAGPARRSGSWLQRTAATTGRGRR